MKKYISFICGALVLLTSLANIGLIGWGDQLEDSEIPLFINLKAARFDPLLEKPNISPELTYQKENDYYLVQCKGPIQTEWVDKILNSGAIILGYIPDYTYILYMEKGVEKLVENLQFVRWTGIYHPAYKIEDDLLSKQGLVQLNVMVFRTNDNLKNLRLVKEKIMTLGGRITREDIDVYTLQAEIDASKIKDIAFIPEVEWMDEYSPPKALMDNIRVFTGAESPLHEYGFTGTGIVGEVKDNGIDQNHPEIDGQLIATDGSVSEEAHGTSTFGIVFAKGVNERATGMMPGAQGVFCDWGVGRKQSISHLVNNWGGVFQSNSWSTGSSDGSYASNTRENDEAVFEYDVTMLYACGNGGGEGDITREATGKNVIAVGGLNHYDNTDRTDDQHTGTQGTQGPTQDGRIKPDVVGPYDSIYTTTSGDGYTSSFGGTSGATPVAAGAVGLIYEMYKENHFGNNPGMRMPHASTVKAILIADAYQYEFSQGDRFAQGWGLMDVGNVYNIGENHFIDDENNALRTGDVISYKITPTTSTPLKISLVWTDVPGTTSSSMHLINDLSLRVTDPNDVVYHGNFGLDGSKWSLSEGGRDHINNVENVFIENPISGEWTIEVMGENIPMDGVPETSEVDQSYALVASGVLKYEYDLRVHSLSTLKSADTGQNVPINATIMNIGKNNGANIKVQFLVDNKTVETTTIDSLEVGEVAETNFVWIPYEAREYYISVYVEPLSGETSLEDNRLNEIVDASPVVGRVLVDDGHGTDLLHYIYYNHIEGMGPGRFKVSHTSEIITTELLNGYDVFITAWPTQSYTLEEIASIEDFVSSGGGLLVIGKDEQGIYNDLTDFAGIEWGTPYLMLISGDTSEINQHEITENVNSLYFGSHELPLNINTPAEEIAFTYDGVVYSRPVLAAAEYGLGKVVAIADEECLNNEFIYENDNRILGENIIRWFIKKKPIAIIDSPLNNDEFLSTDTIFFDGSSSYDPDGDDLTYLWSSNISGEIGNTVSFSLSLPIGQHTITLEVSDETGLTGTAEITLKVLSPPTVTIKFPNDGSLLSGNQEVSGNASDNDGTVQKVEVRVDGGIWQEATDISGSGDWSSWTYPWDTTLESDGSHIISVQSLDNDGLNSLIDSITVTVDNTPPIISGAIVSSKTHEKATIEWETDEISNSYLEYWVEDSSEVLTKKDEAFVMHHSFTLTGLSPSTTYLFRLESTDMAGNTQRTDEDGEFTTTQPPDTTPPYGVITDPEKNETLKGEVPIKVDASDDFGVASVEFYINNKLKFTDDTPPYSWLWDTADGQYPDGQYYIKIEVKDTSSNKYSDEIPVTLDNEIIEPSIVKKRVTPNTVMTGESTEVLFTLEVSDPENIIDSINIDLSSIGRSSNQKMYDDGSHGDEEASDLVYSFETTVLPETVEGDKSIAITLTYSQDKNIETSITLYVIAQEGDGIVDDDGSIDEQEDDMFWLFLLLLLIIAVTVIGLAALARKRRRPKNEVVVVPLYEPSYYQDQNGYYQDQTRYYRQEYYR